VPSSSPELSVTSCCTSPWAMPSAALAMRPTRETIERASSHATPKPSSRARTDTMIMVVRTVR